METIARPKCYSYLRFSRPEQVKGDSVRRQIEAGNRYAKEHDLIIDTSLSMRDEGLSAFRSKHVKKGDLGDFLQLVKIGKIPRGSYLLVESLDRLSRDGYGVAMRQFLDLTGAGITIVTLMDGQTYTEESINKDTFGLMGSLTIMARAHEESLTKSKRLLEAWAQKRLTAPKKPMTARCSAWMRLNKTTRQFELIEDRCEIINQIFDRCIAGQGVHAISKWLNQAGIKPWGKAKIWGISSIAKILKTRAVLGELQPMTEKRTPIGTSLTDYYPAIIDEEKFTRAQEVMHSRRVGGGQVAKISNLFTHITVCGNCGASMHRQTAKGGRLNYLICTRAKAGAGCNEGTSLQYNQMESVVLQCCKELDLSFILSDDTSEQLMVLKDELENSKAKAVSNERKRRNLKDAIAETDDKETRGELMSDLAVLTQGGKELESIVAKLEREITTLATSDAQTESRLAQVNELAAMLINLEGEELVELRRQLRHAISGVVKKITCFPNGLKDKRVAFDGKAMIIVSIPSADGLGATTERLRYIEGQTGRHKACFLVEFANGHSRFFQWDKENGQFAVDSETTKDKWIFGGESWEEIVARMNRGSDAFQFTLFKTKFGEPD